MLFGLQNAGATFQCLMNLVLDEQVGRNVQVYVDDAMVKSRLAPSHPEDLAETFNNLCKLELKLNPKNCAFRVREGKLLGFLISQRGIEGNPEKI